MKFLLVKLWRAFQWLFIVLKNCHLNSSESLRVFYGGGISGNYGGAFVKIKRLQEYFPPSYFGFNIVYKLSNAIFLSPSIIMHLKKRKIPIILNQNGVFYPGWYEKNWKKKNQEMAFLYHQADYVFWQSNFCKLSANKFLGKRIGQGEVLYNAVDTNFFKPTNKKNKNFNFLITGNIDKNLNYRVIAAIYALNEVVKRGYKFNLLIAGKIDKITLILIKKVINDLGLKNFVKYIGKYNQNNAPKIYQTSHVYVMLKYKDPCPNTVIEAMSCGMPILFSMSGGIPELVDKKCGLGLKVKDSWKEKKIVPKYNDIANGMIEIYKNYKFMSKNARKRAVEKFDIKHWISRHEKSFKKYLTK